MEIMNQLRLNKEEESSNGQMTLEAMIDDHDKMTVSALLSLSYMKPISSNSKCCRYKQCRQEASKRSPFCQDHIGSRTCEVIDCKKYAQGGTQYCISHGGGHRCTYAGCNKGARGKYFCALHGGGRRCTMADCNKLAVGGSSSCAAHGGGRKCSAEGCGKAAQSPTSYCVRHGGGRQCSIQGCVRVSRGKTGYCASHGNAVRSVVSLDDSVITSSNEVFYEEAKDIKNNEEFDCTTPPIFQFCMPATTSPILPRDGVITTIFGFTDIQGYVFNHPNSPAVAAKAIAGNFPTN